MSCWISGFAEEEEVWGSVSFSGTLGLFSNKHEGYGLESVFTMRMESLTFSVFIFAHLGMF